MNTQHNSFSVIRPDTNTPFHIDFDWWQKHDNNWRIHLKDCLCEKHQQVFAEIKIDEMLDWIDPQTGEVTELDGLQKVLIEHCAKEEGFVTNQTTLVDSVFRVLLANGNKSLTPTELAEKTSKSAEMILKTLAGSKIYKGIRPYGSGSK